MHHLTLSLEPGARIPMYEQLYRYFVAEIRAGRLLQGEKLPSKRALCAHLGVSRSTVEMAYDLLASEGYVSSRPRSGYFISESVTFASASDCSEHGGFCPAVEKLPGEFEFSTGKSLPETGISHFPAEIVEKDRGGPDFSTASVDVSLFPYTSWAKLTKEVVYGSPELLQRGQRQGDAAFREALAAFLAEYRGVRCTPEQIIVGAGMEYLSGLLLQLFPRDAVFGMEDPGYVTMSGTIRSLGRETRFLPLDEEGLSDSALEQSDVSVAYITPSHQFPMGVTMPAGRRSRLLRWASGAPDRYLVEDDYDSEFRYGSRPLPAMQGLDGAGRVVYIGTFSRSLAPSIRIAYMVLPPALLERYYALSGYQFSTVSRYEQAVMARFLSEGFYARYLRRVGGLYLRRRNALVEAMESVRGVHVSGSGGGLHFLVTNERYSEAELLLRAMEQGIEFRGLSAYCHRCEPRPSTLVAGFGGLDERGISEAARRLAQAWR